MRTKIDKEPYISDVFAFGSSDKRVIPAKYSGSGNVSLEKGFPPETSTPPEQGGVPPKREDFNGIFNLLSGFSYYAQSGGVYSWSPEKDYLPGFKIYHKGINYECLKATGPGYGNVTAPGKNMYWREILSIANESDIEYLNEDSKIMTPLKVRQAIEAIRPFASAADNIKGKRDDVCVTPGGVNALFSRYSYMRNGYYILPNDFVIQWGFSTPSNFNIHSGMWPVRMECFSFVATLYHSQATVREVGRIPVIDKITDRSFLIGIHANNNVVKNWHLYWIALGMVL